MPIFYFDIADGYYIADEEGQEFDALDQAREEAIRSIRSILREEVWKGRLPLRDSIQILDEQRRPVAEVSFADAVTIV